MNKLEESATYTNYTIPEQTNGYTQTAQVTHPAPEQESTLRAEVEKSLKRFFQHIEDEPVTDLHRMVMSEVEAPLLAAHFIDFLGLLKEDGQWQIVNKMFTTV